jgi:hypothetical protein
VAHSFSHITDSCPTVTPRRPIDRHKKSLSSNSVWFLHRNTLFAFRKLSASHGSKRWKICQPQILLQSNVTGDQSAPQVVAAAALAGKRKAKYFVVFISIDGHVFAFGNWILLNWLEIRFCFVFDFASAAELMRIMKCCLLVLLCIRFYIEHNSDGDYTFENFVSCLEGQQSFSLRRQWLLCYPLRWHFVVEKKLNNNKSSIETEKKWLTGLFR